MKWISEIKAVSSEGSIIIMRLRSDGAMYYWAGAEDYIPLAETFFSEWLKQDVPIMWNGSVGPKGNSLPDFKEDAHWRIRAHKWKMLSEWTSEGL